MKKILAIAVAAALTAPMAAMADTTVSGSLRALQFVDGGIGGGSHTADNGSRFRLTGSNTLDNGMKVMHRLEMNSSIAGGANVSMRNSYLGFGTASGAHTVLMGSPSHIMDDIDDPAGVLVNGSFAAQDGDGSNVGTIKYIGKFGGFGVLASVNSNNMGGDTDGTLGLTYKAGPFYAGLASRNTANIAAPNDGNAVRLALAYDSGALRVGFSHSKTGAATAVKSNTLGVKYSFGKAWVAAAYSKNDVGADQKNLGLDLGYKLGGATKVYLQYKDVTNAAGVLGADSDSTAIGFQHDF